MSKDAEGLVWARSRQGGGNLLMLLKIADLSDDEGRNCFAEVPHLARRCRMSIRGAQYMLQRLVRLGEIEIEYNDADRAITLRGGRSFRPKWFLHVRCCYAWDAYQAEADEGAKVAHSEAELKRGRPRRKFASGAHSLPPLMRKSCAANAQVPTQQCAKSRTAYKEGSVSADPLVREVQEPAAPPSRPEASENLAVITKLAHEVLDLYAQTADVEIGEITEAVKRHCAVLHIGYDSDVVRKAIDSACYQRRQAGKPSVIPWLSGEAAYRLTEEKH